MALIPFEDSSFLWGQAGIAGTGINEGEKTTITGDLNALKAVKYITQEASATTSAEQSLGALTSGLLKNTVAAGVGTLSIAGFGDLPAHGHAIVGALEIIFDGGGSVLTTGAKADIRLPWGIVVTEYNLFANQSGAIQIDIWRDTYTNYPPDNSDSVTGSAPCIIPATNDHWAVSGAGLTGWDTTWDADNILRFNIDSVTSIQRVTLVIKYTRTII